MVSRRWAALAAVLVIGAGAKGEGQEIEAGDAG